MSGVVIELSSGVVVLVIHWALWWESWVKGKLCDG